MDGGRSYWNADHGSFAGDAAGALITRVELPTGGTTFVVSDAIASEVMVEGSHVLGDQAQGVRLWAGITPGPVGTTTIPDELR